jgi:hypothetical protein
MLALGTLKKQFEEEKKEWKANLPLKGGIRP